MNIVQPAAATLLADPSTSPVMSHDTAADDFALDSTADSTASEDMSKHSHDARDVKDASDVKHAKNAKDDEDDAKDDAAVQQLDALMALLLTPTESKQPTEKSRVPNGLSGVDSGSLVKLMGLISEKKGKAGTDNTQQPLSQDLQDLFTKVTGKNLGGNDEQHAKLARLSTQDLHALESTRQHYAADADSAKSTLHTALKAHTADHVAVSDRPSTGSSMPNIAAMSNMPSRPVTDTTSPAQVMATPVADTRMEELGEKLNNLLKDRIQFQLDNEQQISTIRLDPPSMGKLEIAVHLDGNQNLNVHIGANQADVMKTLQQFSEQLRQHLVQQNFLQVNVQVSSDGQSQQQHQQRQDEEVAILSSLEIDDAADVSQRESILLKV